MYIIHRFYIYGTIAPVHNTCRGILYIDVLTIGRAHQHLNHAVVCYTQMLKLSDDRSSTQHMPLYVIYRCYIYRTIAPVHNTCRCMLYIDVITIGRSLQYLTYTVVCYQRCYIYRTISPVHNTYRCMLYTDVITMGRSLQYITHAVVCYTPLLYVSDDLSST